MREFNTREGEGTYSITFETDDRKAFDKVQDLCRMLIDAVYVVRCKDCIYYDENELKCLVHSYDETEWYNNDFCSRAERKYNG